MSTFVKCPTCGKQVEWSQQSKWKPFCSERCKLIDLGAWADGSHSIPCEEIPQQTEDQPEEY